jgi:hypothetical protein
VTDANPLLKGYFYFKKSGKKNARFVDIFTIKAKLTVFKLNYSCYFLNYTSESNREDFKAEILIT